ncbi:MAG: type II toxin-antitoxin system RelE/ParE family toxin [Janthinobacterium lividum]
MAKKAQPSDAATPAKKIPAKAPAKPRADIHWESDSKMVLCGWPTLVRADFGIALEEMQEGRPANLTVRPMPSIGKGIFELKTDDESKWYRLMYLARIGNVIHVLHCFEKDTRKTEKRDLDKCLSRLKKVQQRLLEERKNAKHKQEAKPRNKR